MDRRSLLRSAVVGAGSVALGGSLWREAAAAEPGPSRYGPLRAADVNGVRLPDGFTSRVVARTGRPVGASGYLWHPAPDGGACFPVAGGGWTYVSNSEVVPGGGASALRFGADGTVQSAYRILSGTRANCAGGATPWGCWLSCEEVDRGAVFETDPSGATAAVRRPAMGLFQHEAAAVDPELRVVYLTEDERDGCFYRFRPSRWPDLSAGSLQVMVVHPSTGATSWRPVPDPAATTTRTRYQVSGVARFAGGEGAWYADGSVWFTTKYDNRVWRLRRRAAAAPRGRLRRHRGRHAPARRRQRRRQQRGGALRGRGRRRHADLHDQSRRRGSRRSSSWSATAARRSPGRRWAPSGRRLYFSSQRGTTGLASGGVTFEVRGPFRRETPTPGPWRR